MDYSILIAYYLAVRLFMKHDCVYYIYIRYIIYIYNEIGIIYYLSYKLCFKVRLPVEYVC